MDVILPKVALTMTGGIIVEWHKALGDRVRKGEPLFAFETDKTTIDVEAEFEGVLASILARVGEEVPAGATVAVIQVEGEDARSSVPAKPAASATGGRASFAPAAAQLAAALGVDLATVAGTGTGGRIIEQDVIAAASARGSGAGAVEPTLEVTSSTASRARRALLTTLEYSASAPVFHLGGTLDFSAIDVAARSAHVSVLDVVAVAAARALLLHPDCNGGFNGAQVEPAPRVRIGVLVRQGDTLIPIVFDDPADETAAAFCERRRSVQDALALGKVSVASAGSPTFMISNLGPFGVEWFTAMLYPGTAVTLALGAMGAGHLAASEAAVVLTCDHRVIDGVDAARFLRTLCETIPSVPITAREAD